MRTQKVIVPKGLINPKETTIIEIPQSLQGRAAVVAKLKTPISVCSLSPPELGNHIYSDLENPISLELGNRMPSERGRRMPRELKNRMHTIFRKQPVPANLKDHSVPPFEDNSTSIPLKSENFLMTPGLSNHSTIVEEEIVHTLPKRVNFSLDDKPMIYTKTVKKVASITSRPNLRRAIYQRRQNAHVSRSTGDSLYQEHSVSVTHFPTSEDILQTASPGTPRRSSQLQFTPNYGRPVKKTTSVMARLNNTKFRSALLNPELPQQEAGNVFSYNNDFEKPLDISHLNPYTLPYETNYVAEASLENNEAIADASDLLRNPNTLGISNTRTLHNVRLTNTMRSSDCITNVNALTRTPVFMRNVQALDHSKLIEPPEVPNHFETVRPWSTPQMIYTSNSPRLSETSGIRQSTRLPQTARPQQTARSQQSPRSRRLDISRLRSNPTEALQSPITANDLRSMEYTQPLVSSRTHVLRSSDSFDAVKCSQIFRTANARQMSRLRVSDRLANYKMPSDRLFSTERLISSERPMPLNTITTPNTLPSSVSYENSGDVQIESPHSFKFPIGLGNAQYNDYIVDQMNDKSDSQDIKADKELENVLYHLELSETNRIQKDLQEFQAARRKLIMDTTNLK